MIKVGQVVKLKNPKKREAKRRWRVIKFPTTFINIPYAEEAGASPILENLDMVGTAVMTVVEYRSTGVAPGTVVVRRLDTATHRLERNNESNLVPISFWERITKRWS